MERLNNMQLQLPVIGQSGNWGRAVNQNFRIIGEEIQKIYNSLNSFQYLIGANLPYIKVDETQYFVVISYIESEKELISMTVPANSYVLRYYSKAYAFNKARVDGYTHLYYFNNNEWHPSPPSFLAAYVVGFENSLETPIWTDEDFHTSINDTEHMFYGFERGDLMVPIQEFGSLYGNSNYITFKKYPPMGEYYKPLINGTPYTLQFEKQDYVTWFLEQPTIQYTLPSIGMGSWNKFLLSDPASGSRSQTEWTITVGPIKETDKLSSPQINWFYKEPKLGEDGEPTVNNDNPFVSAFVAFSYITETTDNETTFTIKADISNITQNADLRCEVYFVHNNTVQSVQSQAQDS